MRLLALDPGGKPISGTSRSATGWSLWSYGVTTPLLPIAHGQVKGDERVFVAWWMANADGMGADEVVAESFVLDGRTLYPDITPKAIEGALIGMNWGVRSLALQRNTMKSHMPDAKIKSLGLWWPGEPHAVDSLRHAFAYMKLRRHAPTVNMLYPDPGPQLRLA